MDEQRFDNLTRLFGSGLDRRKVLRGLLGGAGALAVAATSRQMASADRQCRTAGEVLPNDPAARCQAICPAGECRPGNGTGHRDLLHAAMARAAPIICVRGVCVGEVVPECDMQRDCGDCQECEGGECVDLANCCTSDSDCGDCQECEGGYCVDLSCGSCSTCGNHICTPIENCCISDRDCGDCQFCEGGLCADLTCGPCESCGNHTCTPYAKYCPDDGGYCYSTNTGECCYDEECGDEYCVDGKCKPCRYDSDCPDCSYCSNGTCYGECNQSQECCDDVCVKTGTCCKDVGDTGAVRSPPVWDGSPQLDCCDGLVCCENWNSQGSICAECCNDWDCDKGAYCHEGWCKWPDEECDHDKDCPKGTCCCKDGSCSGKCCDKPHPPKPPSRTSQPSRFRLLQ